MPAALGLHWTRGPISGLSTRKSKDQQSETNIYFPLLCNLTFFSICHNHKYSSVMAVPKKLMKMKTLPKRRISKSPRLFETITLEIQRHGTE